MTFIGHGYTGAVAYHLLSRAIGVDGGVTAPVLGAVLGSAPDTFDWLAHKLLKWPRWWLYGLMHHHKVFVVIEVLLVAPGLHVIFDKFLHHPVIPRAGMSRDYDLVLFTLFGTEIRRRDVHWVCGEIMLASLTTNALQLWL